MVACLCQFIFSWRKDATRNDKKMPREKTKFRREKTKKNAMRKDAIWNFNFVVFLRGVRFHTYTLPYFSHDIISFFLFHMASFCLFSFHTAPFCREKTKWREPATIGSHSNDICESTTCLFFIPFILSEVLILTHYSCRIHFSEIQNLPEHLPFPSYHYYGVLVQSN